ncbi:hypothetical protein [Mangrovicoccus sp. HB161399]|uniref:hypothetical protein n=1 Tax=Mangrovicoccus sp. HB161399 TaxID=2720392 RepID=UPI0015516D46|nr:hypothetical protein [Mangrovicoccus sp. HB161399]
MTGERVHHRTRAAALMAHAMAVPSRRAYDRRVIDGLIDEIAVRPEERFQLYSLVKSSQDPDLPPVVLDLIRDRQAEIARQLDSREGDDRSQGVWAQRLGGGSLLAAMGFLATGTLGGGMAAAAVAAGAAASWATTRFRSRITADCVALRSDCARLANLETLVASAGAAGPGTGN